jgi:hypothetical protein
LCLLTAFYRTMLPPPDSSPDLIGTLRTFRHHAMIRQH